MSNPLVELQNIISKKKISTYTAKVVGVSGQKITVRLNSGVTKTVWGAADSGATVMISGSQIIAVVSAQNMTTVYVP